MRRWQVLGGLRLSFGSFGLLFVSIAGAAEPADGVPDSASVVLRVKAPQASLGKLGDFVDAVQPGTGAVVKGNLATLGLAISNPTLAGVDVEKDWWAIAFAESRQRPAVVFVVPTTDVNEAKNALPPEYRFHSADKLAIYSESEDALNKVRDRLSGKGTALWSKIDASSKKLFGEAGMQQLVMYQPNRSLQTFGGDKAEMQSLLTSLDSTTTNDVARTAARKRFFDKANVVVLVDLARLAVSGLKLAARENVIQIDASVFDGLQLQPSYIGGAIACEATAASAQLEIPVAQAQGIATIVSLVMQHYNRTP